MSRSLGNILDLTPKTSTSSSACCSFPSICAFSASMASNRLTVGKLRTQFPLGPLGNRCGGAQLCGLTVAVGE
jgi:hypothetical protein